MNKEQEAYNLLNSVAGIVCRSVLIEKGVCTEEEFDKQMMKVAKDVQNNAVGRKTRGGRR